MEKCDFWTKAVNSSVRIVFLYLAWLIFTGGWLWRQETPFFSSINGSVCIGKNLGWADCKEVWKFQCLMQPGVLNKFNGDGRDWPEKDLFNPEWLCPLPSLFNIFLSTYLKELQGSTKVVPTCGVQSSGRGTAWWLPVNQIVAQSPRGLHRRKTSL